MAKRENQGLHIALIALVIVSVILIVTTYLFWSRSKYLDSEVTRLKGENQSLMSERENAREQARNLKIILGYPEDADPAEILAKHEQHMSDWGDALPEGQKTYTHLPEQLFRINQQRHQRISELSAEIQSLNQEIETMKKEHADQLAKANEALAQKEAQLRQVDQTAKTDRTNLNTDKSALSKRIDDMEANHKQVLAEKDNLIASLTKDTNSKQILIEELRRRIDELTNENNFDTPDGRITFVNPKAEKAYINLGSADGMRRQITFSVFGTDVNNLAKESPKAKIEVTKVIDDHLSEARIIDPDISDPVLSGDVIYTPIWNANSALRFALLGKLDINNDGKDDREHLKHRILLHNGKIDAEDVDGEIKGQITRNTRYLVIDEDDSDDSSDDTVASDDASAKARRAIVTQMLNEASRLGVEVIELDRLIEYMGYNGSKRIVPLGKRARAEDFPAEPQDGVIRSNKSDSRFRTRRPPSRTSAY